MSLLGPFSVIIYIYWPNKSRSWFLNFLLASVFLQGNKPISAGNCEHQLVL